VTTQTLVFGANMRRSEKWRLYQIRTANSTYELEVQSPTPGESRRCCVLTCISPADRAGQAFEDSSPRVGEESLFAFSPLDWIGKTLTVGTARTSEVQSVEFLSASDAPAPRRKSQPAQSLVFGVPAPAAPAPRAKPAQDPPTWAPFPLGYVQMAEAAASVLQTLDNRRAAQEDLRDDSILRRRLEHALSTCRLMLESLDRGH
jgi:hypothetical protein